jgi:hypothetical protein
MVIICSRCHSRDHYEVCAAGVPCKNRRMIKEKICRSCGSSEHIICPYGTLCPLCWIFYTEEHHECTEQICGNCHFGNHPTELCKVDYSFAREREACLALNMEDFKENSKRRQLAKWNLPLMDAEDHARIHYHVEDRKIEWSTMVTEQCFRDYGPADFDPDDLLYDPFPDEYNFEA